MKYLIVGTGRSGTGYMSQLFNINGLPCGHEEVCGYPVNKENYIDSIRNTKKVAESSWLAVPYLKDIAREFPDLKYIHITRDPVKTIKSFYEIDFFSHDRTDKGTNVLINQVCKLKSDDALDMIMTYWIHWHKTIRKVLCKREVIRLNIDDLDYEKLSLFVGQEIKPLEEIVNIKEKLSPIHVEDLLTSITSSGNYKKLKREARFCKLEV